MGARRPRRARPPAVAIAALALALSSCGGGAPQGSDTSSTTAPPPCDAATIVSALQAEYGSKVHVVYHGHLVCSGNLAEITVMIENLTSSAPGYTGPVGAPHGAFMRYAAGAWKEVDLTKANPYCTANGRQTTKVPKALGQVCGIQ